MRVFPGPLLAIYFKAINTLNIALSVQHIGLFVNKILDVYPKSKSFELRHHYPAMGFPGATIRACNALYIALGTCYVCKSNASVRSLPVLLHATVSLTHTHTINTYSSPCLEYCTLMYYNYIEYYRNRYSLIRRTWKYYSCTAYYCINCFCSMLSKSESNMYGKSRDRMLFLHYPIVATLWLKRYERNW